MTKVTIVVTQSPGGLGVNLVKGDVSPESTVAQNALLLREGEVPDAVGNVLVTGDELDELVQEAFNAGIQLALGDIVH